MILTDIQHESIGQRMPKTTAIFIMMALSLLLPMVGGFFLNQLDVRLISLPVHSLMETAGSIMAFSLAILVFSLNRKQKVFTHFHWASIALVGMGMLDLFHAMMLPGELFVWLHSLAVLTGGILFILVWLPEREVKPGMYLLIPVAIAAVSVFISLSSILFPEIVPKMLVGGEFTGASIWVNAIGGICFFLAGINFLERYWQDGQIDDLLFTGHTFLFGTSGFLFATSTLWDLSWWLWHMLRLIAYFIAFYYSFLIFMREHELLSDTKAKLIRSQKNAESANHVASDFLFRIGKEISVPMNTIIGTTHKVLQTKLDDEQVRSVKSVQLQAENLIGKIKDIRDYIKIESDDFKLDKIAFRLGDVLENVGNFVRLKSNEKEIKFSFDFSNNMPVVLNGDPVRLGQILINFGKNAVDVSSEQGTVVIGGELDEESDRTVQLHFWVRDSGPILTQEQQAVLFKSINERNSANIQGNQDIYLRFDISRKLVELMDGEIKVENNNAGGNKERAKNPRTSLIKIEN